MTQMSLYEGKSKKRENKGRTVRFSCYSGKILKELFCRDLPENVSYQKLLISKIYLTDIFLSNVNSIIVFSQDDIILYLRFVLC